MSEARTKQGTKTKQTKDEQRKNQKRTTSEPREIDRKTKKTDTDFVKVVKEQKINKKTGQIKNIYYKETDKNYKQKIGSKKTFIDKNGQELEGTLQDDGLYHFSNPKKVVILYKDRLDIIEPGKRTVDSVTTETTPFATIIETFNNLKNDFNALCIDTRHRQEKIQDDLKNLETFYSFNLTKFLDTTFEANKEYRFQLVNNDNFSSVRILFSNEFKGNVDLDYINIFFKLAEQHKKENKNNIAFSLNKYIRAFTGKQSNEEIRKMDKDFFLNKLLYFAHTFCDVSATQSLIEKWKTRNRDAINEEMATALEEAGIDIEDIKEATTREIVNLDPVLSFALEVFRDEKGKVLDAVFHIKPELFKNSLYSFVKGVNEFVTLNEKYRKLPNGVHWTQERHTTQLKIARGITNYVKQGKIVYKQDFLAGKEFKTRKAKSDYIKMLKGTLKHLQDQGLQGANDFYFDGGLLKLSEHANRKPKIAAIENKK